MGTLLATWILSALSVLITASIIPGIEVSSFWGAMKAAAFIGIVNALIRPFLQLVTLPITFLTLGLFLLVVNGICLSIAGAFAGEALIINNFFAATLGAVVLTLINGLLANLFKGDDESTVD